jgi:hypothetical protein
MSYGRADRTLISLKFEGAVTILADPPMTPLTLSVAAIGVVVAVAVYLIRRSMHPTGTVDLGVVSSRWLSEVRRDDPWNRS